MQVEQAFLAIRTSSAQTVALVVGGMAGAPAARRHPPRRAADCRHARPA